MSYDGEICQDCGFPVAHFVGSYWNAADSLWRRVMVTDDGILCPPCFTGRARELGLYLAWQPCVDGVREGVSPL